MRNVLVVYSIQPMNVGVHRPSTDYPATGEHRSTGFRSTAARKGSTNSACRHIWRCPFHLSSPSSSSSRPVCSWSLIVRRTAHGLHNLSSARRSLKLMVDTPDVPDQWSSTGANDPTDTPIPLGTYPSEDGSTSEAHSQPDTSPPMDGHRTSQERDIHQPTSPQGEPVSDAVSVHSMPVVYVTETQPALRRRPSSSSLVAASSAIPPSPLSPSRPQSALGDNPRLSHRRDRHRSAIEVRTMV